MITIGLDLSLTGTGVAIKRDDVTELHTIKTKPADFANDLLRIQYISDQVAKYMPPRKEVNLVCIEDFFTHGPSAGSAIKLIMLGTIIRMSIFEIGYPFALISPMSLKKWITGKGNAEKSLILRDVFSKLGITAANDNEADATCLGHLAVQILLALNKGDTSGLPKHQKEVLTTILGSKAERCYNLPI